MSARQNARCIHCDHKINVTDPAIVMILFLQTVGIHQRQKSKAERIYICPQCAVVRAMGNVPRNGPLNVAAYRMLRAIVGNDPSVTEKAWESLNHVLAPALPEVKKPALPVAS